MPFSYTQTLGGLARDELAGTRDLEGRGLDGLGNLGHRSILGQVLEHCVDDARAADTPTLMTSPASPLAVHGTGHEGVVLNGVAEHDELAAGDRNRDRP